jgi:hypothetical protein
VNPILCGREANVGDATYKGRDTGEIPDKNKDVYKNLDVN